MKLDLTNPYLQIIAGFLLLIFSVVNLKLTPRKLLDLSGVFMSETSTDATSAEREKLQKEGVSLPLGCWTFLMGLGLILIGGIRIIAMSYE